MGERAWRLGTKKLEFTGGHLCPVESQAQAVAVTGLEGVAGLETEEVGFDIGFHVGRAHRSLEHQGDAGVLCRETRFRQASRDRIGVGKASKGGPDATAQVSRAEEGRGVNKASHSE